MRGYGCGFFWVMFARSVVVRCLPLPCPCPLTFSASASGFFWYSCLVLRGVARRLYLRRLRAPLCRRRCCPSDFSASGPPTPPCLYARGTRGFFFLRPPRTFGSLRGWLLFRLSFGLRRAFGLACGFSCFVRPSAALASLWLSCGWCWSLG